ncbi:unnamed protein product [Brassicogethes aeneus]|uniref:Uncharacterized protein n=1 Tax=Brassicogethes aeneus TaxID=1431903 RepID=A0A9P0BD03_BRAAE|nr:unnamed protein product [Brassicogethes aeneus]
MILKEGLGVHRSPSTGYKWLPVGVLTVNSCRTFAEQAPDIEKKMKHTHLLSFLLFLCATTTHSTKISLEDIEIDNLKSEKKARTPITAASSPTQYGFVPTKTLQNYIQKSPKPQYVQPTYAAPTYQNYQNTPKIPLIGPQQYYLPKQYPTGQDQPQQYYGTPQQYQQYENVQFVTDNSIQHQSHPQQYVYLQQYPASSTSIQTIVDPKSGQLQYVMYVPSLAAPTQQEQTQEVVYQQQPEYSQETTQEQYAPQYVEEKPFLPASQAPLHYEGSRTQYIQPRQPKSLLDSYVPSYLQIQYYKQQQQHLANSVAHSQKLNYPIVGKTEYVKSYKPGNTFKRRA